MLVLTTHSFGNPHGLSVCNTLSLRDGRVEVGLRLADGVWLCRLKVWEAVVTEPINGVDDWSILWQDPSSPGVYMTDPDALQSCTSESVPYLSNVVDDGLSVRTDAGLTGHSLGGAAVEVFGSDTDTHNSLPHSVGPEVGRLLEGDNLVVDVCLASGAPYA